MSELIQESKYITVQEFLPKWTDFMESHTSRAKYTIVQQHNGLDISRGRSCLVGEAHGFGENAIGGSNCRTCHNLAVGHKKINDVSYLDAIESLRNFYTFKQGLYDHFVQTHPEKLERK